MMPLSLANAGEDNVIKKIGGSPEVKKHLENRLPFAELCNQNVNLWNSDVRYDIINY